MGRRKKTPKRTLAVVIQDKSPSMSGRIPATISGYNEYVQSLKEDSERGEILLSLTQFDTRVQSVYSGATLDEIPPLDILSYKIDGYGTALYDAVGRTVRKVEKLAKSGDKVLIIIMTDGEENSSKEYTRSAILDMFKSKRAEGWEFIFLGAGEESWDAGMSLGFDHAHTVFYGNSEHNHGTAYRSLGSLTTDMGKGVPVACSVSFQGTKAGLENEAGSSKLWEGEPKTGVEVEKVK